jgi:hypothetical protein
LVCDHTHHNGEIRGWICSLCNWRLGWYEKFKESIHKYLKTAHPFE